MQRGLLLLAVCVGAYYALIYHPLSRTVAELDQPLTRVWTDLVRTVPPSTGIGSDYYAELEASLLAVRKAAAQLEEVRRVADARIEPDAVTRTRMRQPFQLFEFQSERQTRLEELNRLATKAKVQLDPGVSQGFPEYLAEQAYPELLWPQLQLAHVLVAGAIHAGVSTVTAVRLAPVQWPARSGEEWLAELVADVELSGSASAVATLLEMLPMRAAEIRERQLPEMPPNKPVMFIRGLVIRKEGREHPGQVRLELSASMLVRVPRPSF
jgi:hypothetical protein